MAAEGNSIVSNGQRLFEPRSIAVVGASPGTGSFGGGPLANLQIHGYEGALYPVNPKYAEIRGLSCYSNIEAIPGEIDVAILAIPAQLITGALIDCATKHVKLAVVISSGFAETGSQGAQSQRQMVNAARAAGVRLLGPNCLGFINIPDRIPAVATAAVQLGALWPGKISMVSQSGALGIVSVFVRAHDHGVGYRFVVSSGNESDLHALELMQIFIDDPKTRVVAGLIEELRRPEDLPIVAESALVAGKPIVVLKIGRSEGGTRAASAHTAALAGSDEVYEASFRTHGIVRVDDLDDLWQVPDLFASVPLPGGRRIGVISTSGGLNGLLADLLHREGLDVPRLSPGTADELSRVLPPYAVADNPLDLTGGIAGSEHEVKTFASALRLLDRDPRIDAIVLTQIAVRKNHDEVLAPVLEVIKSLRKPVVLLSPGGSISYAGLRPAHRSGIPLFTSPQRCARALGHLVRYADYVRSRSVQKPSRPARTAPKPRWGHPLPAGPVDAETTWRLLQHFGLPLARREKCGTLAELRVAADGIGYPVALKASALGLLHKTDAGGVALGLRNGAELEAAYNQMRGRLDVAEFEVQEMVEPGVEMIVGVQHDPHFGPVVLAGSGGILVELVADRALRVAPFDSASALHLIQNLKAMTLLSGFRGLPRADIEELTRVIANVSELAADLAGNIESLDLNPVIVLPAGRGVRIVDAALLGRDSHGLGGRAN